MVPSRGKGGAVISFCKERDSRVSVVTRKELKVMVMVIVTSERMKYSLVIFVSKWKRRAGGCDIVLYDR